ncbi:immunoglobulin-like and fibronectin type III domain-containing protein 1 isoform X4 [Amphiprion ocellaris]|uniref:immunoglobulin-like and fibronectin type III domain-containing protein 1 isoform X4 n=1 Tax=Amphiprion ocellaris TaxID=80972 RepID=UPI002410F171|nr:immunoglobulin-like and fibronectin type III domain-containing protein 1 isoform X4 [Amphiprion ocellaris]
MWKSEKKTGSAARPSFSIVHRYIQHFNEVSGSKSAALRRRSKTPGVMITQYVMNLPEGKSTPDFISKPTPLTIDEGKLAVFKAVVKGDPKPEVSWKRAKGNILEKQKFLSKYDESTGEYILEIHNVTGAETDTYKCHAVNEYGKAVWTTTLTVNEASTNPADFRKLLKKSKVERADGESDEKFWDAMLNADRKDYERICSEFGVTDLHSILKKLEEKKKERAQNKCKDGVSPYDEDEKLKNDPRSIGRTKHFSTNGLMQNGTGLYEGDVDEINLRNAGLNQVGAEEFNILSEEYKQSSEEYDDTDELEMSTVSRDEIVKSNGNKSSAGSVKHRKKTKKVHWKEQTSANGYHLMGHFVSNDTTLQDCSDFTENPLYRAECVLPPFCGSNKNPKELESDTESSESDEDEASLGQVKHLKCSKRGQKPKDAVSGKRYPNELESDSEPSESDKDEDSTGQVKHQKRSKQNRKPKDAVGGESKCPKDNSTCDETEDVTGSSRHTKRKRQGSLIEDLVTDPGVQFIWGLSDVSAIINETAELTCKLSSEHCEGVWFRDNKKISPDDHFSIAKDGPIHKLVITKCVDEHSGKYRFEADGRKTEAMINVKDPPRFHPEDLNDFTEPVIIKVGHNAIFKLHFVGFKPIKIKWYREGEELHDDTNTKIEKCESRSLLLLSRCQRKDTGEIKIKLKNEHGFTEAVSQLIVLDKPTSPLGPAEVTESSAAGIEFKWRPPKDDGGSPVINYIMERQQVGRNTWKKIGEIPGVPCYRDTDVDRGRKYCYRIRAVTAEGTSEVMETDEMQAGTLAFPGPPAPPKVVSAFDDCINLSWAAPSNTGGSRILGYILEKRKKGSNLWTVVNAMDELIKEKKYAVKDVVEGMEYEFRVTAINLSGPGESSNPSEFVFARDPKKPPGKVTGLKVTETSYSHFVLTWTKPEEKPEIQDEARGYFVEIRQADCLEWSRCNSSPIIMTSYSVKGLKSMDMYWVRVIATNDGGESVPEELSNYVLAMPSPVRPKFTNNKMKTFIVVRAGNSVRITVNFEASPRPDIMWLKDNIPVTKRVTISNSDGSSQLLIPSSERSDSGIYSILVKNLVGQETFSTEVRVTDDPKPPGPVQLEENVPETVTVIWEPSPDEKRDDRLHYTVSKLDSTKRTWSTVADRLFNNKFTVCNIMHGREYHFRVYAKNDMGISAPSESPTWGMEKKKSKFVINAPTRRDCDLRCAPSFIVPLKLHSAPKGYECHMSCAVKGNPTPRITWYRNHVSLNTNTNYYTSNTCGVCSMLILRVGPKDMGEYTITAENSLGRAECSTVLSVQE